MDSTKPVVNDTLRQLTVSELDLTKGSVSIRVLDRDGKPVKDQQLTLNPGGRTAVSEKDGCAVFSSVPSGTYTVALVARTTYVDTLGATTAARTVSVTGGNLTRDDGFRFDRRILLQARWPAATVATYPILPGTGLTISNPMFTGDQRRYPLCTATPYCATGVASGATGADVGGLFPAADGYRMWAGTCADSTPAALPAAAVVAPDSSAVVTVPVAPVIVSVLDDDGDIEKNQVVKVMHVADAGCTAAISRNVSTPGNSHQARFSLPAGTWTFSSGGGEVKTAVVQPGSTVTNVTVKQAD